MDVEAVEKPGTDEWWFKRLASELARRRPEVDVLKAWMDGKPPIPAPDNMKPGFERLQEIANVNVAELVVEARLHRMQLLGASTRTDHSANGDDEVAALFEAQDLKQKFHQAFWYALGTRHGYIFLDPPTGDFRVSGPGNSIVARDAFGRVVAGLNMYRDDVMDRDVLALARPGYTRYATHDGNTVLPRSRAWTFSPVFWDLGEPVPHPEGLEDRVLAYELTTGKSLIEKHLPTLERINHTILQRMIMFALQAFKQRALKNAPLNDPGTGEEIDYDGVFESSPDALWLLPEGVEIWESGQADMTPILNATRDDLRFLAVTSKTPLYMISPDDANGSAEGASTQRETLTFDVEAIVAQLEGEIKRSLSDALLIRGETERADLSEFKLIWSNPRRSSLTERAQAAATAAGAGIPFRMVLSKFAEFSPDEVEDAVDMRSEDVFLQSLESGTTGASTGAQAGAQDVSAGAEPEDGGE